MERLYFGGNDALVLGDDDATTLADALSDAAYVAWMNRDLDRRDQYLLLQRVVEPLADREP